MSEENLIQDVGISEIKKSGGSFVPGKPKYSTRHLFIANEVPEVIGDYEELYNKKDEGKFVKREMLPPLTAAYRLSRDIKAVARVQAKLKKEIAKCEMDEVERQRLLEEVIEKCEELRMAFAETEVAYAQLEDDVVAHQEIMKKEAKDFKRHEITVKRYLRAGECLAELRKMMEGAIKDNNCYYDFIGQISGESGMEAVSSVISRFERNVSIKKELSQSLDKAFEKTEKMKVDLFKKRYEWERDLTFEIEKLQAMHNETYFTYSRNAKYEKALNNVNIVSVEHQTDLTKVLSSVERIIDNLIRRKVIGKSYRTKTLAQQIDAIRDDYLKKKAVIREYEKAKENIARTKLRRLELYTEFSDAILESETHSLRLKELYGKKKIAAIKKVQTRYSKMRKSMGISSEIEEEQYDPLTDQSNILKVTSHFISTTSIPDKEDIESVDDSDKVDLTKYSSGNEVDSALNDGESPRGSIVSAGSSFSDVSLDVAISTTREMSESTTRDMSGSPSRAMSRSTSRAMQRISRASQESLQGIDLWRELQSFMEPKR